MSAQTGALFAETDLDPPLGGDRASPAGDAVGPVAEVALEQAVDKALTYRVPPRLAKIVRAGQRVKVPLGRRDRSQFGFVTRLHATFDAAAAGVGADKLKYLKDVADERVLVDADLLDLARWMSRYYCTSLGLILETMIPGAVKNKIGVGYTNMVSPAVSHAELQILLESTKAKKRRSVLARLLQIEAGTAVELVRLAGEAGVKAPTLRRLAKAGVVRIDAVPDLEPAAVDVTSGPFVADPPHPLNPDQQAAYDAIAPRVRDACFSTHLLLGVTGSGKTEVYLRLIADAVAAGRQAVMLVPEIALTPQTVRRFTTRFSRVAVLHSGLSAGARHRFWQQIASGKADVVVGARSAVFAPVTRGGLIVVDEEHEPSYKQDTAPRYHARDVAIKRAQALGCPVVLGSATPSLESFARTAAASDLHHLHRLPTRVGNRPLPKIEIVDLRQVARVQKRKGVHLLSPRLEQALRNTLDAGHQAMLLLNRRGYASFVYNPGTDEPVTCRFCDATMTYHRSSGAGPVGAAFRNAVHTGQLHCHYCLAVDPLDEAARRAGGNLTLFGLGTQRVEEEMARKFPDVRYERVDSDTMRSGRDYERTLEAFGRGEISVLLGTQMIAKGLDFPNVALVGVVSGDTALSLPDFRAAERTFSLVTQVAGRAGRGDVPGRVLLQTFNPYDPTIRAAVSQDYDAFASRELDLRRQLGLPPFGRMARLVVRDQDEAKAIDRAEDLAAATLDAGVADLDVRGPMPCPVSRIANYYRQQIVLKAASPGPVQKALAELRRSNRLAQGDRVAVDVDPVSLL